MGLLEHINTPADVKKLSLAQLDALSSELREFLIQTVSQTGGHLASNLGVVELTLALHHTFSLPADEIIWDVGHQSYTHKILTGRKEQMHTLRQKDGVSGFPKPGESVYDAFIAGHSSTSISVAAGIARAKTLKQDDSYTIAVIGDGSFTGGLTYEALNNAGRYPDRLIVVLNDNEMSISKNVGSFARYLAKIRTKPGYYSARKQLNKTLKSIPVVGAPITNAISRSKGYVRGLLYHTTLFEDFGFAYIGPVDGHDTEKLCAALVRAKEMRRPVVVHVDTVKGKGYPLAEKDPGTYHGVPHFNFENGKEKDTEKDYSKVFGAWLVQAGNADPTICAITAAMKYSTGLQAFSKAFPQRFFDVGIAEAHAVTFAAGLAKGGFLPVFAVYSTFLQRAYDQIIQDAAIAGMHMVFAVDRAGIVGEDGETHQGIFDVAFLSSIPGVTVLAPGGYDELSRCLHRALYSLTGPVAVRYPRGKEWPCPVALTGGETFQVYKPGKILLVSYGRFSSIAAEAVLLLNQIGVDAGLVKITQIAPLDTKIIELLMGAQAVFFAEEVVAAGSVSQTVGNYLLQRNFSGKYFTLTVPNRFISQAKVDEIFDELGFTPAKIANWVQTKLETDQ